MYWSLLRGIRARVNPCNVISSDGHNITPYHSGAQPAVILNFNIPGTFRRATFDKQQALSLLQQHVAIFIRSSDFSFLANKLQYLYGDEVDENRGFAW